MLFPDRFLVSHSLFRAVTAKRPDGELIHHSDKGSQYCSQEYRQLLDQFGMITTMMIYTHVLNRPLLSVKSPADL